MKAQIDIITEDLSLIERLIMPVRKMITENTDHSMTLSFIKKK
jgi:hypothetical protein